MPAVVLFLAQLAATLFMTGLIWFVQIVHYPLFAELAPERQSVAVDEAGERQSFTRYIRLHGNRTSLVVGPPMLLELTTALLALAPTLRPTFLTLPAAITSVALVLLIWASTAFLQIPLHNQLGREHSTHAIRRLVLTNWLRTAALTTRSILLLHLLANALER